MRYTKAYIPTLRETSQDVEAISQKLLLRAGMVRRTGVGEFVLLPMGQKSCQKIVEELKKIFDGEEIESAGTIRIKDEQATDPEYILGLMKVLCDDINSYKQLPKCFTSIEDHELHTLRPRFGLLKSKTYKAFRSVYYCMGKDNIDKAYEEACEDLKGLLQSFTIDFKMIDTLSPYYDDFDKVLFYPHIGGNRTNIACESCKQNMLYEIYPVSHIYEKSSEEEFQLERVYTPDAGTIEDITAFLGCSADRLVKTLLYKADGKIVAALVRGDRELSEAKLKKLLKCRELIMADEDTVKKVTGAKVGFAGPVGLEALIVADNEILSLKNVIVGANESDYHFKNINIQKDFNAKIIGDIKCIDETSTCPSCGGNLNRESGFVFGSINRIDKETIKAMGSTCIDEDGKQDAFYALSCWLNLYTLLASIIECNHDEAGIVLPSAASPYKAALIVINPKDELQMKNAENIYLKLKSMGIETLFDDRNERPGVKFKDIELLGIPARITVGKKIDQGIVEFKSRVGEMEELAIEDALNRVGEK